jgi:plasmid stabilization system protein ParE
VPRRFRLELSAPAARDIGDLHDYIARDKPRAAANWARQLRRKISSLRTFPLRHEIIPEAEELNRRYRHLLFGKYRVIYQVEDDRVLILRVIHAARQLGESMFRP